MSMVKVAIVGAGYMAEEHARAFTALDEFSIVGVCSRTENKGQALALKYGASYFASIEQMYLETKADLVIVAVNELSTFDVCKQVFQYPWLCFLEKPVGYNFEQAKQISQLAFSYDQQPFVAFNRRSYSSTRVALKYLEESSGSRLVSILDQQDRQQALAMGQPELVVTNYMFANSIHLIDYFNIFCRGQLVSVNCPLSWNQVKSTHHVATLCFSSGDIGVYQAIWDGPGPWSVRVTDHNYHLEMRPLEKLKIQVRGERVMQEQELDIIDSNFKPGLYYQALQILNYFKGKSVKLATLNDSLVSMNLCEKIYQSSSD